MAYNSEYTGKQLDEGAKKSINDLINIVFDVNLANIEMSSSDFSTFLDSCDKNHQIIIRDTTGQCAQAVCLRTDTQISVEFIMNNRYWTLQVQLATAADWDDISISSSPLGGIVSIEMNPDDPRSSTSDFATQLANLKMAPAQKLIQIKYSSQGTEFPNEVINEALIGNVTLGTGGTHYGYITYISQTTFHQVYFRSSDGTEATSWADLDDHQIPLASFPGSNIADHSIEDKKMKENTLTRDSIANFGGVGPTGVLCAQWVNTWTHQLNWTEAHILVTQCPKGTTSGYPSSWFKMSSKDNDCLQFDDHNDWPSGLHIINQPVIAVGSFNGGAPNSDDWNEKIVPFLVPMTLPRYGEGYDYLEFNFAVHESNTDAYANRTFHLKIELEFCGAYRMWFTALTPARLKDSEYNASTPFYASNRVGDAVYGYFDVFGAGGFGQSTIIRARIPYKVQSADYPNRYGATLRISINP